MTTVARLVGKKLKEAGIDYVFGLPGGETVDLMHGFKAEGVEFVLTHHEAAAGFMADAYGYITGKPGVCMATVGPGATNLVSPVAHAFLDRAPVIAMSAQLPVWRLATTTHQVLDLQQLFSPITKWTHRMCPDTAAEAMNRAIMIAQAEQPGPVYLEFPSDIAKMTANCPEGWDMGEQVSSRAVDAQQVNKAVTRIGAADRPVILVGLGAVRADAGPALQALAERLRAPVIVTPKAKGIIAEDHDLFVGTLEMAGTDYLYNFLEKSDLLIGIGFDAVELDRPWPSTIPMVHIDTRVNVDRYFPSTLDIAGPTSLIVTAIADSLERAGKWGADEAKMARTELFGLAHRAAEGLCPYHVIEGLRAIAPKQTVMTVDVGAHKMATGQFWKAFMPRRFLMSNGLSSMGYGVPAALAAKLLHPDDPVCAIVGDGGFGMTLSEMETARRLKLGIIVTVMQDAGLTLIRKATKRRGYEEAVGVDYTAHSFAGWAKDLSIPYFVLNRSDEVEEVYRKALAMEGPVLVEARVNPEGYA